MILILCIIMLNHLYLLLLQENGYNVEYYVMIIQIKVKFVYYFILLIYPNNLLEIVLYVHIQKLLVIYIQYIGYVFENISTGTKITFISNNDIRGSIPKMLVNHASAKGPFGWFGNLRKACA